MRTSNLLLLYYDYDYYYYYYYYSIIKFDSMHSTGHFENSKWFCRWNKTSSQSRLACLCLKFCGVVWPRTVVFARRDWWASKHIDIPSRRDYGEKSWTHILPPTRLFFSSQVFKGLSSASRMFGKNGWAAIQQEIWETCCNLLPPTCFILQAMDGQQLLKQSKCHPNPWHYAVKLLRLVGHPFSMPHRGIHARCIVS